MSDKLKQAAGAARTAGSQQRVVQPDGVYDNTSTMCREVWRDGRLHRWTTSIAIQKHPEHAKEPFGTWPDVSNKGLNAKAEERRGNAAPETKGTN